MVKPVQGPTGSVNSQLAETLWIALPHFRQFLNLIVKRDCFALPAVRLAALLKGGVVQATEIAQHRINAIITSARAVATFLKSRVIHKDNYITHAFLTQGAYRLT